ncbi:LysR substrate-binding domain-containing protein [Undibacterium sp.]|jgi:DNA-binding transcriptional LysR family regulator|uniref:LysR substrate-binding domain-containing protein n=1 Tax=Undibacterium sp. TaxID=1914977 RepID=UPI002BA6C566|nr:LysR substrate-binding domain-containing protein [Undibacterium sp.]HTD06428.1 LysR substrate-binding domain-containing protein [Undibacterium sp.]
MDLRQLRYFVTVAEELHFGRAAEKLHISQPPLSLSIQQLEKSLGVMLLLRTNKTAALTSAGAVLYSEARKLLKHAADMEDMAARVALGIEGRLKVGFVGAMLFRGLPEAINAFQKENPRVDIVLREMNTTEQIEEIRREQIDVGFIHAGHLPPGIQSKQLLEEPFVCCLPNGHRYAKKAKIDLRDLADETFVLFPRAVSPHYHDRIVALCTNAGFSPRIRHEVRHWLTIVGLVGQNMGIALVPLSMQKAMFSQVTYRPLTESSIQSETLCIWHDKEIAPALSRFIDAVKFPAATF